MAICVACHPRGTYTTPAFRTAWNGRPLSELFDLVREKMPKSDPGSLTPAEYAQSSRICSRSMMSLPASTSFSRTARG